MEGSHSWTMLQILQILCTLEIGDWWWFLLEDLGGAFLDKYASSHRIILHNLSEHYAKVQWLFSVYSHIKFIGICVDISAMLGWLL